MRRAVGVLLVCSALTLLGSRTGGAATTQPVTGAPSIEVVVRSILASLPPQDVARVRSIEFAPPSVNVGACAETWVSIGRIVISPQPACLVLLLGVLTHEIGHLLPECAALAYAQQWHESESCAERYRAEHEARWRWGR